MFSAEEKEERKSSVCLGRKQQRDRYIRAGVGWILISNSSSKAIFTVQEGKSWRKDEEIVKKNWKFRITQSAMPLFCFNS